MKKIVSGRKAKSARDIVRQLQYDVLILRLDNNRIIHRREAMTGAELATRYTNTNATKIKEVCIGFLRDTEYVDAILEFPSGLALPYRIWSTSEGKYLLMRLSGLDWELHREIDPATDLFPEISEHILKWNRPFRACI